jgi:membrane-bound serine protease (ClpP class)
MKRFASLPLLVLFAQSALAAAPVVRFVDFEAVVHPFSADRILRAIDDAEAAGDTLVLIQLDTPGGMTASMDEIVKAMLSAEVPTVVWVGPSGARAASAGFFILMAADVAAMAPGTRTGAASTVMLDRENREDDVLLKKANEDNAALCRSMAGHRRRNVDACTEAVMEAKAYEEQVALERGLIDFVARDRDELLQRLDGFEVRRFDGSTAVLETTGATFASSAFDWRHKLGELLAQPVVAYFLLMLGLFGIYVEFTHPGMVLPGVVGAASLLLFAFSAQALPVSVIGVLLIALAVVMFILEIKVTSFGMLTLGGVLCLIFGSLMLIDGPIPELRVPVRVVLPTSIVLAGLCVLVLTLAVRAQRGSVTTGVEGLLGAIGTVTRDLAPRGQIFVHGEIWSAHAAAGATIAQGARVRVVQVKDMQLTVEPAGSAGPEERS